MGEQLAGAAHHGRGGAQFAGAGGQRALNLVVGDDGFLGHLLVQRAQAKRAVEAARYGQLASRASPHGQADQAGVAHAAARLGHGGFKLQAGAQVLEVKGAGDGVGHGAGFFGADAGAAHGLFERLAATNLHGNGFGGGHAGRSGGGGVGLGLKKFDLFRRQRWNLLGLHLFKPSTRQQGDADGGAGGQQVRRKPNRLAAWIELSHGSPANQRRVLRQTSRN